MTSINEIGLEPVWVNPGHMVSSAKILMKGHGVRAIAVMDGRELLGLLSYEAAEAAGDRSPCGSVMRRNAPHISSGTTIVRAAQMFVDHDWETAAVMEGERFLGVLTSNMLLRELRRSWDPLTGLNWSDRIREWCTEKLERGEEISVLFIDLDDFGAYNKQFGHVVGDRVLRRLAQFLKDACDPTRDILVRFGGDEFVLGTTRLRLEAEQFAGRLRERSGLMEVEESTRPVTFSIGVAGGRRSVIRPDVHVAAMVDELLNSASRDCLSRKRSALPQDVA